MSEQQQQQQQQQQSDVEAVNGSSNQKDHHVVIEETELKANDGSHGRCFTWMTHHHLGWLARIPGQWPRTVGLVFGVILPLFLLIGLSLFFGYGLARLEAPREIEDNNEILVSRAVVQTSVRLHGNVTEELPKICLGILVQQDNNSSLNDALEEALDAIFVHVLDYDEAPSLNDTITQDLLERLPENTTLELLDFMAECGAMGLNITDRFVSLAVGKEYIADDLTFNWIRCDGLGRNESTSLLQQVWGRPYANRTRLQPDVQSADAIAAWRYEAKALYDKRLEELLADNTTSPINARIQAYQYATQTASGFDHCYTNSAAGAWFWFTVMTTIGYGNTAPSTQGGRAMIYTLGFLSILLFAVILGTAGTIVCAIWDDFINRTKLHQLNIPWVACIFWGFCYYAWMLVIAIVTQNWKSARLGEEMDFSEAYWFSYISTTTVGLGDYYLEHDVILRQDLFVFPVLFLTGFVLLANFFVKLTAFLTNLIPDNMPHCSSTLEETLAESDVPCMPKLSSKHLNSIKSVTYSIGSRRGAQQSKGPESNENDADLSTQVLQVGNEAVVGNEDDSEAYDQTESVPMEVNGWKGTVSGVATLSPPAESAP